MAASNGKRRSPPTNREAAIVERPEMRSHRMLDELESLILREGFLHLRTEDLARRLHCSKRTLYRLARTREDLFELIIEKWLTRIREDGLAAIRSADAVPQAVSGYLHAAVTDTRDASPAFVRDLARFPAGTRRLMLHQKKRIAGLEKLIDEGVRTGAFRGVHARLVAEVLLVAVARIVDPELLAGCELTMSEAFGELYNIFEYGMSAGGPAKEKGKSGAGGMRRRRAPSMSPSAAPRLAAAIVGAESETLDRERSPQRRS